MACWSLSVGKHFPQAVQMITSTTIAGAFLLFEILRFSIYRLNKKQLANSYPQEVADLVLFCLKTARDGSFAGPHLVALWNVLRSAEVSKSILNEIRSEALRRGIDLQN